MKKIKFYFLSILVLFSNGLLAQQPRKQLRLVDIFDAGQPQAVILKLYDQQSEVLCYVLMPENAGKKYLDDKLVYEANSIGSISCVKQVQLVIPAEVQSSSSIKR